jgi:serine/threonine protein kinase
MPVGILAGRYKVVRPLGVGGMGSVFLAEDLLLRRRVAVKVLYRTIGTEAAARGAREARLAASLNHPNIVAVHDFIQANGLSAIVMEYVEGSTLAEVIATHGPYSVGQAELLLRQVSCALAEAHAAGIVHRDVKPSNILLDGDRALLTDFGIARGPDDVALTAEGKLIGTYAYMSPETVRGAAPTTQADIWALGATIYFALEAKLPFEVDGHRSDFALLHRIMSGEPAPEPEHAGELSGLLQSMLSTEPNGRPSAADICKATSAFTHYGSTGIPLESSALDPERPTPAQGFIPGGGVTAFSPTISEMSPNTTDGSSGREAGGNSRGDVTSTTFDNQRQTSHPHDDDLVGTEFDRQYRVLEFCALGHTGRLYKAYDSVRGTIVALKVLSYAESEQRERLERASRIWLNLQHENLVKVFEIRHGTPERPAYIVSEFVEGQNLEEFLSIRTLAVEHIVSISVQLCQALAHIHDLGVIHREVKPSNILVSQGLRVTLLDSGLARHSNPEVDSFTRTGVFIGDISFAAPEQYAGTRVDQQADVYAVASILYLMTTGKVAERARDPSWAPDDELLSRYPDRLVRAIRTGLERSPKGRFNSVREMHDLLAPLAPPRTTHPKPVVVALHGIRTHASWQRAFSEVGTRAGFEVHLDRWNFGYFSIVRFLWPTARLARVRWFRRTYEDEFRNPTGVIAPPSIVAHSFGTYILGNALLRYPYLRVEKVLLCGSILPTDFPWNELIERGQVQSVRNEFGTQDVWTRVVKYVVPRTGPSGLYGFREVGPRMEQERFDFAHSEYFERGHMANSWLPFLQTSLAIRPARQIPITHNSAGRRSLPLLGLYLGLVSLLIVLAILVS